MSGMNAHQIAERDAAENPKRKMGYVYFVEMEVADDCFIKVGFTEDLYARLASLKTSTPFDLRLLHWFPGTKFDEERLHKELAPHHRRREWFCGDGEIEELIEDIYEYQVDVFASGPDGRRTDLGDKKTMDAVSQVPMCGYWEWRRILREQNAS